MVGEETREGAEGPDYPGFRGCGKNIVVYSGKWGDPLEGFKQESDVV